MNVSCNWIDEIVGGLPEHLDGPKGLADHLTMVAAAVEKIETVGVGLDGILVARVLEVGPHPNADRLSLCKVDRGDGQVLDVVCGAPVIAKDGLYPHVAPGGTLPDGFKIESRKIRGEMSHGMLCSEVELQLGRDKGGIMRLSDDLEPGQSLAEVLGLPDTRLALDLNPNRVDLASHLGVAREVGHSTALVERDFGTSWSPSWQDGDTAASGAGVSVTIEDLERCPRYMGAVIRGVKIGPSPAWLTGRLLGVGARPINNVVDATNYVMLERNQPLHAFDLATIPGGEVRIRAARSGEKLKTLDGDEHELSEAATVIADHERAIALAGVMGGHDTEVTDDTVDLLIECGSFDPMGVRRTRGEASLSTDASYRFERGIDVHAQEAALARCVELILAIAGGEAEVEAVRVGPRPPELPTIDLRVSRVDQVLGYGLDDTEIHQALDPVGFETIRPTGAGDAVSAQGTLRIAVPGWRSDVTREIDLVEEVARRVGYNEVTGQDRRFRPSAVPTDPRVEKADRVRELLAARGLLEARSLSFMPEDFRGNRATVAVPNPLSAEESYLRGAMVPVLLRRLEHNFARGHRDVRLYEIGTVFSYAEGGSPETPESKGTERFAETERVALVMTGARQPEHWSGGSEDLDLWDLKATIQDVATRLCSATVEVRSEDAEGALAGPWIGAGGFELVKDGQVIGVAGAVAPASLDAPPWAGEAFAFEFELSAVESWGAPTYVETSPYPAVSRDLSVTVPSGVLAADLEAALSAAASDLLESVRLFDVYAGEELGDGRRALGWAFRFRAQDRTLTDEDVESEMKALSDALEERFDAKIRQS